LRVPIPVEEEERFFVTIEITEEFLKVLDHPEFIETFDVVNKVGLLLGSHSFNEKVVQ
jgi:hypothetical protein